MLFFQWNRTRRLGDMEMTLITLASLTGAFDES